jgi:hypothetical protein
MATYGKRTTAQLTAAAVVAAVNQPTNPSKTRQALASPSDVENIWAALAAQIHALPTVTAGQVMNQNQFDRFQSEVLWTLVDNGTGEDFTPPDELEIHSRVGTDLDIAIPINNLLTTIRTTCTLKRFGRAHAKEMHDVARSRDEMSSWGLHNGFPPNLKAYAFDCAEFVPNIDTRTLGAILAARKRAIMVRTVDQDHVMNVAPEFNPAGHLDAGDHRQFHLH